MARDFCDWDKTSGFFIPFSCFTKLQHYFQGQEGCNTEHITFFPPWPGLEYSEDDVKMCCLIYKQTQNLDQIRILKIWYMGLMP